MHITGDTPSKHKLFVAITAEHDTNGIVKPTILHWEDGRKCGILIKCMTFARRHR